MAFDKTAKRVSSSREHHGRPRSEAAHTAALSAAWDGLRQLGFRRLTMEGIARRAGISKATVYRWWSNKAALVLEAVNTGTDRYPEFGHSDNTREALRQEVRGVIRYFKTEAGSAFLDLASESRFDSSLAHALSQQFVTSRREATRQVLADAAARGHVRDDVDVDTLMDMVWGAIYYRFLILHDLPPLKFADQLVEQLWSLIKPIGPE